MADQSSVQKGEAAADSVPGIARVSQPGVRETGRAVASTVGVLLVVFAFARLVLFNGLKHGDEGNAMIMAQNIARDFELLVHPSYRPLGGEWQQLDGESLTYPPLLHALVAGTLKLTGGSLQAGYLVPFAAFVATAYGLYRLLSPHSARAGLASVVLFTLSVGTLREFGELECEPLLTAFGVWSLVFALSAIERRSARRAAGAGALLGLAFLAKLWLILPFVMALGVALLLLPLSPPSPNKARFRLVACTLLGFLVAGSVHLLLVAAYAPQDLGVWLRQIYLGVFLQVGNAGHKFGGAGVEPNWVHGPSYYFAILLREQYELLPIFAAGLPRLASTPPAAKRLLAVLGGGSLAVLILSIPAVKEPLYILPVQPLLFAIGAVMLGNLQQSAGTGPGRAALARAALTAALFLAAVGVGYGLQAHSSITRGYIVRAGLGLSASVSLVALFARVGPPRTVRTLLGAALALAALLELGFARAERKALPYAEIAERIRPYVEGRSPGEVSFVATEFRVYMAHLFRRGRYWRSFYQKLDADVVRDRAGAGEYCAFIWRGDIGDPNTPDDREMVRGMDDLSSGFPADFSVWGNKACLRR